MAGSCSNFLFPKQVWTACGGFDERLTSCCNYGFMPVVAKEYDLGLVDQPLFYYNWLDDSLYRAAHRLIRKRDNLYIYRRFDPTLLSADRQARLRRWVKRELLGSAHLLRDEGAYRRSLGFYLVSICQGGWSKAAVLGIAKLIPHKILRNPDAIARQV